MNADRFWKRLRKQNNGCWVWQGKTKTGTHGYGVITINGRDIRAHRYAWLISKGDIPKGMLVLHHCDNPACCNPDHLYLGTQADNMRDVSDRKRWRNQFTSGASRRG